MESRGNDSRGYGFQIGRHDVIMPKPRKEHFPILLLMAVALSELALPAEAQAGPNVSQQQLASNYMAAVRAKDRAGLQALLHPKVAACQSASTREYFDYLANQSLGNVPQGNYKVTVRPLAPGGPPAMLPATMFKYSVQPTQQLQIDGDVTAANSVSVIRFIAEQGGRWYIVYPCPNTEGMKYFDENLAKQHQQQQRAQALAAKVKGPLRAQLKSLLKQERKIDAVHKYQAATGANLTTALQVVDILDSTPD